MVTGLLGEQVRSSLHRLQQEADQWFNRAWAVNTYGYAGEQFPPVNIGETPEAWHIYAFAPGIDQDSLNVSLQHNALLIEGHRKAMLNSEETGQHYYRRERFSGPFRRLIQLPDTIDPEQITAHYKEGILSVTVAKQASVRPRRITVQHG